MRRPKHLLTIARLTLALAGATVGCTSDDGEIAVPPDIGDTRISFSADRPSSNMESTAADTPPAAGPGTKSPDDRTQVKNRGNSEVTYEPATPGFIYIFDETENRIVYSGHLHPGERFVFDRRRSRATVDGVIVYAQDRDASRDYKVYFDRD